MNTSGETYLGDGLYASYDGYAIRLRAPRASGDHWVGLEPDVMRNLIRFAERVWRERDGKKISSP